MQTQRASRPHAAACTSPGDAAPGHQPHSGRKCPGLRGKGLPDHVRLQRVQGGATRDGAQLSAHLWGTWTPSVTSKSFPTEKEFHPSHLTRVWGSGAASRKQAPPVRFLTAAPWLAARASRRRWGGAPVRGWRTGPRPGCPDVELALPIATPLKPGLHLPPFRSGTVCSGCCGD